MFITNKLNFSMLWSDLYSFNYNYTTLFNIKRFLKLFFKLFFEDLFVSNYYFLKIKNEPFEDFIFDFVNTQENIFIVRHFKKIFFGNLWLYKFKDSYIISLSIFFNVLHKNTKKSSNKTVYINNYSTEFFYLQQKIFKKNNIYNF